MTAIVGTSGAGKEGVAVNFGTLLVHFWSTFSHAKTVSPAQPRALSPHNGKRATVEDPPSSAARRLHIRKKKTNK